MIKKLLFITILLLLFIYTFLKNKESEKYNQIVNLQSDFYIPDKNSVIEFNERTINGHELCIYDDSDPNNVDVECINAETLLTVLNLPDIRKNEVCIDNMCINQNDIKTLNGTKDFKIKSKNTEESNHLNKCLSQGLLAMHRCGENGGNGDSVNSLNAADCDEGNPLTFKLEHGANKYNNVTRKNLSTGSRSSAREQRYAHHT